MWVGPLFLLSSGDGYVGELLELQLGCEDPFEVQEREGMITLETPQRKWASSHLEGRTSWMFSSGGRCLSSYDMDFRDPLLRRQERPGSMRVARGPLGILLQSM